MPSTLLGLNTFSQHHFQLFTQGGFNFHRGKQLTVEKICPNKEKQTPLPSVRCSHSFRRRGCSISQSCSKGASGLCHMGEAKTPKRGQSQKRTPVPWRALPKPAEHGPRKVKLSDQTAVETVFPEGSATSAAYTKYFYSKVLNVFFFLTRRIGGGAFLYFLPLQTNPKAGEGSWGSPGAGRRGGSTCPRLPQDARL